MKFPIGAMSVGDIFDRSLKLVQARLGTFYAINLIVMSPLILVQLALPWFTMGPEVSKNIGAYMAATFAGAGLLAGAGLILGSISTAAILHVISQDFVDQQVGVREALAFAFRRFLPLLGVSLLFIVFYLAGLCACGIPWFFFLVWFAFAQQVVVVENRGPMDALSRSMELTKGFRWRVLGVLVLVALIFGIFVGVEGILQLLLPPYEQVPVERTDNPFALPFVQIPNYGNHAIITIVAFLINIIVGSFYSVCLTLFYFDLRIRKEGFDLELAARQQQAPIVQ